MKPIVFTREETADITAKLRAYFRDELETGLAALPAEMLLERTPRHPKPLHALHFPVFPCPGAGARQKP